MGKSFSLNRVSPETAEKWKERAEKRDASRIFVGYNGQHFEPHFQHGNMTDNEIIGEIVENGEMFAGIAEVSEQLAS